MNQWTSTCKYSFNYRSIHNAFADKGIPNEIPDDFINEYMDKNTFGFIKVKQQRTVMPTWFNKGNSIEATVPNNEGDRNEKDY